MPDERVNEDVAVVRVPLERLRREVEALTARMPDDVKAKYRVGIDEADAALAAHEEVKRADA